MILDYLYSLGVYGVALFATIGATIMTVGSVILLKEISKAWRSNYHSTSQLRGRDDKRQ